jgi:hypothetical protein
MNYIKSLQAENTELKEKIGTVLNEIDAFIIFLNSSKFTGTEGGERKDWIATGDVIRALNELKQVLPIPETKTINKSPEIYKTDEFMPVAY